MKKLDLKKELKPYYSAKAGKIEIVNVPKMKFLAVEGEGAPADDPFKHAIECLFTLAYTLKFMIKKSDMAIDYGVMPLQAQWWAEDMKQFSVDRKQDWIWRAMIMQPDFINKTLLKQALQQASEKKPELNLAQVELIEFKEGKAAQALHVGPFSKEGPLIQQIHDFIQQQGHSLSGRHHEIYLSDFRRTAEDKLKTIIRQPFE